MSNVTSNYMVYAGAHFKTCPIELREAWSLVAKAQIVQECIYKITEQNLEFVNIGTCNRFDICFFGKVTKQQVLQIFDLIAKRFYENLSQKKSIAFDLIEKVIQLDFDGSALRRLFKVTASLDSLVLGEQQILGQMKQAYLDCVQAGYARSRVNQIFSHNFKVAKKIRSQTELGKNSVSIGHAAVVMSLQVFESLHEKKVLVIGAGSMAKIVAKNILLQNPHSLSIANRTIEKAQHLCRELPSSTALDLQTALQNIHQFDVCVAAISGPYFILTSEKMKHYEKLRQGNLSVFVDISVPRKIDPKINEIDNIFLFHIDDLDKLMEQNRAKRQSAAKKALEIIEQEVNAYEQFCEQKENLKSIANMHQWLTSTIQFEVERFLYDTSRGKLNDPQVVADAVAKKIVSRSAQLARQNEKMGDAPYCVSEMLDFLFAASLQPRKKFDKKKVATNVFPLKRIAKQ